MNVRRRIVRKALSALMLSGVLIACSDSLAPVIIHPTLVLLGNPGGAGLTSEGFVEVAAVLDESLPPIGARDRVNARIETSGGDAEWLQLERHFCGGGSRLCGGIDVTMRAGGSVLEINRTLRASEVRWVSASSDFRSGSLRVLDYRRTESIIGRMRLHPGVMEVGKSIVGFLACEGCEPKVDHTASDVIGVGNDPARPGDGTLQLALGDTIIVSYVQPDGSTLSATTVVAVPCCPASHQPAQPRNTASRR